MIGDGNIGYILLAEFDDTEKAILNEIMAVLQDILLRINVKKRT